MPTQAETSINALQAAVGTALGPSGWFLVSQEGINAFADAIDAHEPIHVDPEWARTRPQGGTIAQGFLLAGLLPGMVRQVFCPAGLTAGTIYGTDRIRFTASLRSGSRVRLRGKLLSAEPSGPAWIARYELELEAEGSRKPVCVATLLMRYSAKPAA